MCCRSRRFCAARPICCWPPATTGKPVNVKKGQFLAPWDMKNVAAKIASTGNDKILLCERGVSFGYNTLVVDMRALPIMARDRLSGGVRRDPFGGSSRAGWATAPAASANSCRSLARAAVAVGVAAVFIETHQDPDHAPSRRARHGAAQGRAGAARDADRLRPARQGAAP